MGLDGVLVGGIAVSCLVAGLFFLRYWRTTRDRFFLFFALSFWIEGAQRFFVFSLVSGDENEPVYYLARLVAYGLILVAIVDKNRTAGRRAP